MGIEEELIVQCQKGDKSCFGKLVTPYLQDAYAISFSILKSKELAEDAVQNALIEAYRNIMANKEIRKFRGWFLTLVSSRSIDLARKNSKELAFTSESESMQVGNKETPLTNLMENEIKSSVVQAVLNLPLKNREVVILHYFQEFTIQEVSKILGIKEGTVKSRLFKARLALNHLLSKEEKMEKVGGSRWKLS